MVPLKTRAWPELGAVEVRSRGIPCRLESRVWVWVPVRSPPKLPTNSHADRDWKAGTKSTSGAMGTPPMTTRSFSPDRPNTVEEMVGIPAEPKTVE